MQPPSLFYRHYADVPFT